MTALAHMQMRIGRDHFRPMGNPQRAADCAAQARYRHHQPHSCDLVELAVLPLQPIASPSHHSTSFFMAVHQVTEKFWRSERIDHLVVHYALAPAAPLQSRHRGIPGTTGKRKAQTHKFVMDFARDRGTLRNSTRHTTVHINTDQRRPPRHADSALAYPSQDCPPSPEVAGALQFEVAA